MERLRKHIVKACPGHEGKRDVMKGLLLRAVEDSRKRVIDCGENVAVTLKKKSRRNNEYARDLSIIAAIPKKEVEKLWFNRARDDNERILGKNGWKRQCVDVIDDLLQ